MGQFTDTYAAWVLHRKVRMAIPALRIGKDSTQRIFVLDRLRIGCHHLRKERISIITLHHALHLLIDPTSVRVGWEKHLLVREHLPTFMSYQCERDVVRLVARLHDGDGRVQIVRVIDERVRVSTHDEI